jgi:hypothetical protein
MGRNVTLKSGSEPEQEAAMLQNSPLYACPPATDVARARAFYEGKLGFRPGKELPL